jgi:hypothetical protein
MSNSVLTAFNNHFSEFVKDIRRVFPDDEDIETAETAINRLRKANPRIIITSFKSYVIDPYSSQIDSGDISFFINTDYTMDIGDNKMILNKIDALRGPVSQMNKEEQNKVMKYIQNLKKLANMYN